MIDRREEVLATALRGVIRALRDKSKASWERSHLALCAAMAALNACGIEIPDTVKFDFSELDDTEDGE